MFPGYVEDHIARRHIVCWGQTLAQFGLILVSAFRVIAMNAPRAWQDVITGCLPLTIDDAARFRPPMFAEYPVLGDVQGPPAPRNIASHSLARQFRTMLRKGATEGPNFAGHHTIASWGCGSGCVQFAIIDARNGRVFFPPEVLHVSMLHVMEPEDARRIVNWRVHGSVGTARCSSSSER
jgi:hypothetical protein